MAGDGIAAAPARDQVSAVPAGSHGSHMPAEHHMLAPCLSNTARAVQVVLPLTGSSATGLPAGLRAQVGDRTVLPSEHFAEPPDLQKLCISRT